MASWWLAWALSLQHAHAQSYYLESDHLATREAAAVVAVDAATAGCEGQVVRRYVRGAGWRYIFRSDPLRDPAVVRSCRERLQRRDGVVRLVERDGPRTRLLGFNEGTRASRVGPDEVVARVVRALGGHGAGTYGADDVLFRYERRTPAGLRAVHTYARRGDDVYLEVDVLAGEGVSSRAGVAGGRAWLEGNSDTLDPAYVREQLDRFSPEAVLRASVELGAGRLHLPGQDLLRVGETDLLDGQRVVELVWDGDRASQPLRVLVDADSALLVLLERGVPGDTVVWRFSHWRELEDGARQPSRVQVSREGKAIDDIIVHELDLSPLFPDAWFTPSN